MGEQSGTKGLVMRADGVATTEGGLLPSPQYQRGTVVYHSIRQHILVSPQLFPLHLSCYVVKLACILIEWSSTY